MLSKRLGQIADGQNAWLKLVKDDDKIHGKVNPNGAVSGRATHSRPNVSQVPSIDSLMDTNAGNSFTFLRDGIKQV